MLIALLTLAGSLLPACVETRHFTFVDTDAVTMFAARPGEKWVRVLEPRQREGAPLPGGGGMVFRREGRGVRLAYPGQVGFAVVRSDGSIRVTPGTKTPASPADGRMLDVEVTYTYQIDHTSRWGMNLETSYFVGYLAESEWENVRVVDVAEPEDALGWTAIVLGGLTFGVAAIAGEAGSVWGLTALGVTAGGVAWLVWPPSETVRWEPGSGVGPTAH